MADFGNPLVLSGNYEVLSIQIFFAVVGAAHDQGRAAVRIELYAPNGVAVVEAPSLDIYRFVMGTVATVAPGTESLHLDIDSAIDAVLVSAAED